MKDPPHKTHKDIQQCTTRSLFACLCRFDPRKPRQSPYITRNSGVEKCVRWSFSTHWQWENVNTYPEQLLVYERAYVLTLKGSQSCTFVDDFRICVRLRNWPYLCTSVSRFHLGPRLARISVSMLCFCLCKYVFHGCTQKASKYISKKARGSV